MAEVSRAARVIKRGSPLGSRIGSSDSPHGAAAPPPGSSWSKIAASQVGHSRYFLEFTALSSRASSAQHTRQATQSRPGHSAVISRRAWMESLEMWNTLVVAGGQRDRSSRGSFDLSRAVKSTGWLWARVLDAFVREIRAHSARRRSKCARDSAALEATNRVAFNDSSGQPDLS